jgi:hypothetical protein
MAGAEARPDLIDFIGTTEVVPCYKAMLVGVFHQAEGQPLRLTLLAVWIASYALMAMPSTAA